MTFRKQGVRVDPPSPLPPHRALQLVPPDPPDPPPKHSDTPPGVATGSAASSTSMTKRPREPRLDNGALQRIIVPLVQARRNRRAAVTLATACLVALAAFSASGARAAPQRRAAQPETASQCFAKLRKLVAALAKLERLHDEVAAGKVYLTYDEKVFYPVDKTDYEVDAAAMIAIRGEPDSLLAAVIDLSRERTVSNARKLETRIEDGHVLVQAREKRCNDLKTGSSSGTSGGTAGSTVFTLDAALTKVDNPQSQWTKVSGMTADLTCPCSTGAKYHIHYDWDVPDKLVPGQSFSLTMGMNIDSSSGPISEGMTAAAPGFDQQLLVAYPNPGTDSKSYTGAFAADETTSKEVTITIGLGDSGATVTYHYKSGS